MKIPSCCGALWTPGEATATHRLKPHSAGTWCNPPITAQRADREFRIEYGPALQDYAYLRPMADCFAAGFYRDSVPVIAILRKDGEDLVLTFHAVADGVRGEFFVPAIDG